VAATRKYGEDRHAPLAMTLAFSCRYQESPGCRNTPRPSGTPLKRGMGLHRLYNSPLERGRSAGVCRSQSNAAILPRLRPPSRSRVRRLCGLYYTVPATLCDISAYSAYFVVAFSVPRMPPLQFFLVFPLVFAGICR
jgi:hypothetical protein